LPETMWRSVKSDEVLDGEDDDAGGVQTEQLNVEALTAAERSTVDRGRVDDTTRHRLHDVSQHRHRYEEPCNNNNNNQKDSQRPQTFATRGAATWRIEKKLNATRDGNEEPCN